jgi:hypothetical protein
MTEQEKNKMQNMMLARVILSRLLMLGAQIQVLSLDFSTGQAIVKFDPSRSDIALLAALAGGVA